MRSMTGFGQASGSDDRYGVSVSVRSVNSKYLDVSVRLREEYKAVEGLVRGRVESRIERGRVDVSVDIRPLEASPASVEIQSGVVQALHRAAHELVEKGLLTDDLSVGDLLRMPEVVQVRIDPQALDESAVALVEAQVDAAVDELTHTREVEGAQLADVLGGRLDELERVVEELRKLIPTLRVRLRERLEARLAELVVEADLDPSRLAQEVAIVADKSDVVEELDRIDGHLEAFRGALQASGAVGKRLDFLTQELLRELNTLGSKAREREVTHWALEGKLLCEQLREQIQNVE